MRKSILVITFIIGFFNSNCALQAQCIKIESILVDACTQAGGAELQNEMLLFNVGSNILNTSNMNMTFGFAQPFTGARSPDATSAQKINQLNATISACGFLREPVSGVLPANAKVLVISNVAVNVTANPFANLTDTIYVVFLNNTSSANAYFLNYGSIGSVPGVPDLQTITLSFGNGCSSSATYQRSLLLNQQGLLGAQDGATVLFDASINPTYINNGCSAPFTPFSPAWNPPTNICETDGSLNLNSLITGTTGGVFTGTGVSNNQFDPNGLSGVVIITYTVVSGICSLTENHSINVIQPVSSVFTAPIQVCQGSNNVLTAWQPESPNGIWSGTGVSGIVWETATLSGVQTITYIAGTGNCVSSFSQTINVVAVPQPLLNAQELNYCPGETAQAVLATNAEDFTVNWYSDNSLIFTGNPFVPVATTTSNYYAQYSSFDCLSATTSFSVNYNSISATIVADLTNTSLPFNLVAQANSQNSVSCQWLLNGEAFDYVSGDTAIIDQEGSYSLVLICENNAGCLGIDSILFTIINKSNELLVPSVFTPDGDGFNDTFYLQSKGYQLTNGTIYNRWGNLIFNWNEINDVWDGTVKGNKAPAGTYFVILSLTDIDNEPFDYKGTVTLIRD